MRINDSTRPWPRAAIILCGALALLSLSGCGSGEGQETAAVAAADQAAAPSAVNPLPRMPAEVYSPVIHELRRCLPGAVGDACGPPAVTDPTSQAHTHCMKRSRGSGFDMQQATARCSHLL